MPPSAGRIENSVEPRPKLPENGSEVLQSNKKRRAPSNEERAKRRVRYWLAQSESVRRERIHSKKLAELQYEVYSRPDKRPIGQKIRESEESVSEESQKRVDPLEALNKIGRVDPDKVYEEMVSERPGPITVTARAVDRAWMRMTERTGHPKEVQEAARYLKATVREDSTEYIHKKKDDPKALMREVSRLQKKGYHVEEDPWGDSDEDEGMVTMKKRGPIHIRRTERESLDQMAETVTDPMRALHALQSIGVEITGSSLWANLDRESRDPEGVRKLDQLCVATEGVEDVMQLLGQGIEWQVSIEGKRTNDALIEVLQQDELFGALRNDEHRDEFIAYVNTTTKEPPPFKSLPLLHRAFGDKRYRAALELTSRSKDAFGQIELGAELETLKTVEEAGGLEMLKQVEEAGLELPSYLMRKYKGILDHTGTEEGVESKALVFVERLSEAIGENLTDPKAVEFVAELQAVTGEAVQFADLPRIPSLLEQRELVLAYATFLKRVIGDPESQLQLDELSIQMMQPDRIVRLLDPGYAQFIQSLKSLSMRVETRGIIGYENEEPELFKLYGKDGVKEGIHSPEFSTLAEYIKTNGGYYAGIDIADLELATSITRIPGMVSLLEDLKLYSITYDGIHSIQRNNSDLQELLATQPAGTLSDPEFRTFYQRTVEYRTTEGSEAQWHQNLLGMLINTAIQFTTDPEGRSRVLDDAVWERITANKNRLLEKQCNVVGGSDRLEELTDEDFAHLDEYIERTEGRNVVVGDLIAMTRRGDEVAIGTERFAQVSGYTGSLKRFELMAEIGADADWEAHLPDVQYLFPNGPKSVDVLMVALQDTHGLADIVRKLDIYRGQWTAKDLESIMNAIPRREALLALRLEFQGKYAYAHNNLTNLNLESLDEVMAWSPEERQEVFSKTTENSSGSIGLFINQLLESKKYTTEHPEAITLLNELWADKWKLPTHVELLSQLDVEETEQLLTMLKQVDSSEGAHLEWLPSLKRIMDSGASPILLEAMDTGFDYEQLQYTNRIISFAEADRQAGGEKMQAFRSLHERYGVSFKTALLYADALEKAETSPLVASAIEQVRASSGAPEIYADILLNLEKLEIAGSDPVALDLLLALAPYTRWPSIANIESYQGIEDGPGLASFVAEIAHGEQFYMEGSGMDRMIELYKEADFVKELVSLYGVQASVILGYNSETFQENAASYAAGGRESLAHAFVTEEYRVNYAELANFFALVELGYWDKYIAVKERYGVKLVDVVSNTNIIDQYFLVAPDLELVDTNDADVRHQQNLVGRFWSTMADRTDGDFSPLRQFDISVETHDGEQLSAEEYTARFMEKYARGGKAKTLLVLIAASEYNPESSPKENIDSVLKAAVRYERVLDAYRPEGVPGGLHASIGMEYEIMHSTADAYKESVEGRSLKDDIVEMSAHAGIPHGNDGVHEIATAPTDNPYTLLLEMKLLNELEYFDFNFAKDGYERGAHGIHLSIGGEQRIRNVEGGQFLQNSLFIAGWGGMNTGAEITGNLGRGRTTTLRVREPGRISDVFGTHGSAVEMRALSVDKWEPFERAVLASHAASIAIQAADRYGVEAATIQGLPSPMPTNVEELFTLVRGESKNENAPTVKEKEIIAAWVRLQAGVFDAIREHNENFVQNEQHGYEAKDGTWVDTDEFGGEGNTARFTSVLKDTFSGGSLDEYHEQFLKISPDALLRDADTDLANKLTRITNLFLKPSENSGGDKTNALAALEVTRLGNGRLEESKNNAADKSVFDNGGETRKGYYTMQGGSETMIVHAVQHELLQFTEKMHALLQEVPQANNALAA